MNKPYFAKWLPVEGEIKEGDWYISDRGDIFQNKTGTRKYAGDKLVKLFLCSRDIKFGKGIYYKNSPIEYQCGSRHLAHRTINVCPVNDPEGVVKGALFEQDCFQVIGEISPDALSFVKEGDEFSEEQIYMQYYNNEPVDGLMFVKIKGPCGHFH